MKNQLRIMIKVALKIIKMMKMVLNMIYNRLSFLLIADLKIDFMKNLILVFQKFTVMQGNQFLKALFVSKV